MLHNPAGHNRKSRRRWFANRRRRTRHPAGPAYRTRPRRHPDGDCKRPASHSPRWPSFAGRTHSSPTGRSIDGSREMPNRISHCCTVGTASRWTPTVNPSRHLTTRTNPLYPNAFPVLRQIARDEKTERKICEGRPIDLAMRARGHDAEENQGERSGDQEHAVYAAESSLIVTFPIRAYSLPQFTTITTTAIAKRIGVQTSGLTPNVLQPDTALIWVRAHGRLRIRRFHCRCRDGSETGMRPIDACNSSKCREKRPPGRGLPTDKPTAGWQCRRLR